MSATTAGINPNQQAYLADFAEFAKLAAGPPALLESRRRAMERFLELGFPTTHNEDWKYTNLAPLTRIAFVRDTAASAAMPEVWREIAPVQLVFVNGRFAPGMSALDKLPKGVRAGSLAERLDNPHLTKYADFENHALVALNTAFLEDGAFVEIAKGVVLEQPIQILYLSAPGNRPTVSYPRTLILAGRDTQAGIIETYAGPAGFTDAVTELVVGENAVIDLYRVEAESEQSFHFGLVRTQQDRSSNVSVHSIALGGGLVRSEVNAVLAGEGAEATLNGLYVVSGQQHVDNYTTIDHATPRCTSHELYKGVLDGRAQGVFHGRIIVRPDAQKTDAIQRNRNLLLSEDAVINTKPQLEIYADDVRCTHGATVGQVDPEAVFYLQSRGIGREEARHVLTQAFAGEVLDRVKVEALRLRLQELLFSRLDAGTGK